jgi:hypothetical protein
MLPRLFPIAMNMERLVSVIGGKISRVLTPSMIDWGYVAGFFDGEGNLHRDKRKSTTHLRIDNTSLVALEHIQSFVGCGQISNRGRQKPITRTGIG